MFFQYWQGQGGHRGMLAQAGAGSNLLAQKSKNPSHSEPLGSSIRERVTASCATSNVTYVLPVGKLVDLYAGHGRHQPVSRWTLRPPSCGTAARRVYINDTLRVCPFASSHVGVHTGAVRMFHLRWSITSMKLKRLREGCVLYSSSWQK